MTAYVVHVLAVSVQRTAIAKRLFTDVTLRRFYVADAVFYGHVTTQAHHLRVHFSTQVTRDRMWTSVFADSVN